jgi:hypothetical protein
MPKKTVRVTIPTDQPEKMSDLVTHLWNTHVNMGASSPLHNNPFINMTRFEQLMNEAVGKRQEAEKLYAQYKTLMAESRIAFGINKGQTLSTTGTLYHFLNNIKQFLLVRSRGNEEELNIWGFDVRVGTSSVGAKKKKRKKE